MRVRVGEAFDTDIQRLLPQTSAEPVIRAAIADAGEAAAGRVAVLVSGADAARAASDLERTWVAAGLLSSDRNDGEEIARWLFANRNALMCPNDPARFDAEATARRSLALIYSPVSPVSGGLLTRDPFLLSLQLGECLVQQRAAIPAGAVLVSGTLRGSPFRLDVQDSVAESLAAWRARWPDVTMARAGAVFFAEAASRRSRDEVQLIAGLSTVSVAALLIFFLPRAAPILGTLVAAAASAASSLAVTFLVFPSVHVLVFVFGAALIGVTSDYALHFFATGPQTHWAAPAERVRLVFRPLTACALSTGVGFASLLLFGVPVLAQVAVFSMAGIATAWWFTLTLLPLMDRKPRNPERHARRWARLEAPFLAVRWTKVGMLAAGLALVALASAGVARLGVLDDVRKFQAPPADLVLEEERVRAALAFAPSTTFLLSYGAGPDEARRREEGALLRMPPAIADTTLAISRFDPSTERRAENEEILRTKLYAPFLAAQSARLGLIEADPFAGEAAPRPRVFDALEGEAEGASYLVAPVAAAAALENAVSGDGVVLIDPASRFTRAFASFRGLGGWAVIAALGVCALIVFALYRTPRALLVLAAPAAGCVLGLLAPAAFGTPISFFSVAALFVVIGAGIDHSIFQFEAAETNGQPKALVVFLAALTTVLSMGLMAISQTYPVRSFGLAIAAGVTGAYLFSMLPARIGRRGGRVEGQA